jgi:F0F1-type ATP synthase delta subunit
MSRSAVAARYARAIFEVGVETNTLPEMVEQLTRFTQA